MRKVLAVAALVAVAACGEKKAETPSAEAAGAAVDQAVQTVDSTAGAMVDSAKVTADSLKAAGTQAIDSAKAKMGETVEKAGEAVKKTGEEMKH